MSKPPLQEVDVRSKRDVQCQGPDSQEGFSSQGHGVAAEEAVSEERTQLQALHAEVGGADLGRGGDWRGGQSLQKQRREEGLYSTGRTRC